MRLEALPRPTHAPLSARIAPAWRGPLQRLALAWLACLALFAPDWAAMVRQWWDSSTYNHILLVPPIIGWLVWQRAPELARMAPQAWWPGLLPMAGALLVWLLGDISGLATASQLGAVVMLQAAALLLLGPRVALALLFPLAFALFLVPLGDELIPALQMITAFLTIELTHWSGIPAVIDGVFIDTPAGLFEVAEACSGVKFLIAMIALGALVAHLCFRSWWRRLAFMAAAVALPVLANGVRAWGTIYIAQSQGIAFAAGFDHIFYGWIFFALVMAALLGGAWRWFDRQAGEVMIDPDAIRLPRWLERGAARGWPALAALAGLLLVVTGWSQAARGVEAVLPAHPALPEVPGWSRTAPQQAYPWEPRAGGADRRLLGSWRNTQGQQVDVVLAFYAAQEEGREAGAFGEGALVPDSEWRWLAPAPDVAGGAGERLQALGTIERTAVTWYRHGSWSGGSRTRLKLLAMADRLLLRPEPTAMLIVSAEGPEAQAAVSAFAAAIAPHGQWMDRIGGLD